MIHVLVLEDAILDYEMIERHVRRTFDRAHLIEGEAGRRGYKVEGAENVEAAKRKLEPWNYRQPHLIIFDIRMSNIQAPNVQAYIEVLLGMQLPNPQLVQIIIFSETDLGKLNGKLQALRRKNKSRVSVLDKSYREQLPEIIQKHLNALLAEVAHET